MAPSSLTHENRPDPDALLARTKRDARGRLKIFLGAAPGVGKTFAMLSGAQRMRRDGVDVVVGLVETHGRAETGALIEGLEVLPRQKTEYRGRTLEEFDVDAALARRPALLILDELAHTNAPTWRHPKRWQDAQELLDAGIDVWTALNIQHLESLADVVSGITGITVRETVPDTVLQDAADVVLVDITPDELIARLHAGRIYVPEIARRATERFFTPGNLTALRELALRRTADRVDAQVLEHRGRTANSGGSPSERLLVCVGTDADALRTVRRAAQLATGLNAEWLAVHLERPDATDAAATRGGRQALDLAERLGGQPRRIAGQDFTREILQLARQEGVTQIIVGRKRRLGWRVLLRRSLSADLLRQARDVDVHVLVLPAVAATRKPLKRFLSRRGLVTDVVTAVLAVLGATLLGEALSTFLQLPNLSMVFLAAVLFCAVRLGTRAAIISSFLSFLAYNFFFIEPLYSITVAEPHELLALLIFLAVAVLTGSLTGRVRGQADGAMRNAAAAQSLTDFARKIAGAATADEVLWATTAHIQARLGRGIVMLVVDDDVPILVAAWPPDAGLDAGELSAVRWAASKGEAAGWGTGTLPRVRYQFRPISTARGVLAVCGIVPPADGAAFSPEDERDIEAVLSQAAVALDRASLAKDAIRDASLKENEKVRDAVLASLSHDLRTPLASIAGAASSLAALGDRMDAAQRGDLVASIEEETARLARFVDNLLEMSRIEAGSMNVRHDAVAIDETVQDTVERARRTFPDAHVRVSIAVDLPPARGDARLIAQVLFNLLDNAHKYGGSGEIAVHARGERSQVVVSVTDEGPGIRESDLGRVFEKFYRGGRKDGRKAGTGLGLSICKGLVEAMGGTIEAQSPAVRRRGTRIVVRLPVAVVPARARRSV